MLHDWLIGRDEDRQPCTPYKEHGIEVQCSKEMYLRLFKGKQTEFIVNGGLYYGVFFSYLECQVFIGLSGFLKDVMEHF